MSVELYEKEKIKIAVLSILNTLALKTDYKVKKLDIFLLCYGYLLLEKAYYPILSFVQYLHSTKKSLQVVIFKMK